MKTKTLVAVMVACVFCAVAEEVTPGVTITWSKSGGTDVVETVTPQIQWGRQAPKKSTKVTVVGTNSVTATISTTETPAIQWSKGPSVEIRRKVQNASGTVYVAPQPGVVIVENGPGYPWDSLLYIPIPGQSPEYTVASTYVTAPAAYVIERQVAQRPVVIETMPVVSPPVLLERGPYYQNYGLGSYYPYRGSYYGSQGYALYNYPFLGVGLSASFDFRGGGGYYPPYWEVSNRRIERGHMNDTWRNYTGHGQGHHRR
ncbi:MAG: hypothetical protein RL536_669 [Candidatus Parcubacteria bacterium]|jgi:hypothetical protein